MIIWTPTVLSVLYARVLYFCICTCSAQLSMFHMERRSRNTLIIIIINPEFERRHCRECSILDVLSVFCSFTVMMPCGLRPPDLNDFGFTFLSFLLEHLDLRLSSVSYIRLSIFLFCSSLGPSTVALYFREAVLVSLRSLCSDDVSLYSRTFNLEDQQIKAVLYL